MYGDYATVKRLTALGADPAKLQEYCDNNNTGYVILGSGCTPGPDKLNLALFETAAIIPWLLENQEDFTAFNLLGWK